MVWWRILYYFHFVFDYFIAIGDNSREAFTTELSTTDWEESGNESFSGPPKTTCSGATSTATASSGWLS